MEEVLEESQAVIFLSPERLYLPIIEKAIKFGKSVFLNSTANYSEEEHKLLCNLANESNEIIQVYHPYLFNEAFDCYRTNSKRPLIFRVSNVGGNKTQLMVNLRNDLSALFSMIKSNVKQVFASSHTIFNDFPDTYNIILTFDNGTQAYFLIDGVDQSREHILRIYEYGQVHTIDVFNDKAKSAMEQVDKVFSHDGNSPSKDRLIAHQLNDYYQNILNFKQPLHGIENELLTQAVIEKVKEKVRFAFNII
jgi:predicted dehydrogenase